MKLSIWHVSERKSERNKTHFVVFAGSNDPYPLPTSNRPLFFCGALQKSLKTKFLVFSAHCRDAGRTTTAPRRRGGAGSTRRCRATLQEPPYDGNGTLLFACVPFRFSDAFVFVFQSLQSRDAGRGGGEIGGAEDGAGVRATDRSGDGAAADSASARAAEGERVEEEREAEEHVMDHQEALVMIRQASQQNCSVLRLELGVLSFRNELALALQPNTECICMFPP